MSDKSGVYRIVNKNNGKVYVGSASNLGSRFRQHTHQLKNNKHHSTYLQRSWNKYGETDFYFEIILICEKSELLYYEQFFLDKYKSYIPNFGYNVAAIAGSNIGIIRTEEFKKKISLARQGKPANNKGKRLSEEQRKKLKGKAVPQERRDKIRNSLLGRKNGPLSDSTKRKISESRKGKIFSERHRLNMAKAALRFGTEEIVKMKKLKDTGKSYKEIAKIFNGDRHTVSDAINGRVGAYKDILVND